MRGGKFKTGINAVVWLVCDTLVSRLWAKKECQFKTCCHLCLRSKRQYAIWKNTISKLVRHKISVLYLGYAIGSQRFGTRLMFTFLCLCDIKWQPCCIMKLFFVVNATKNSFIIQLIIKLFNVVIIVGFPRVNNLALPPCFVVL